MSLRPVATRTGELLGRDVAFAGDCIGAAAADAVKAAQRGGAGSNIVLLENLRFHPEEEKNDETFARELAKLGDVYVDDAFGAAHRAHASVEAIVRFLPEAGAGLLMEDELRYLGEAVGNPARPYVAVLGGAKVSDKIEVIENLIPRVDRLLIGGAMAYTFLKAQGKPVGRSLVEDDKQDAARDILERAKARGLTLLLPVDHVVAPKVEAGAPAETLSVDDPKIGDRLGLDIGPRTARAYAEALHDARTVVWNGPMGVFEIDAFAQGTIAVAQAVAGAKGTTIVGGGDSIAAVKKAGVADRITHISTGGGASLEFLGGRTLPGVAVLPDR
jgi:phosphoglycerate kinase